MTDPKKYPFKYIHLDQDHGCGEVAFYINTEKKLTEILNAHEVVFPDGSYPKPGDPYRCGSCGKLFSDQYHLIIEYMEENKLEDNDD